MLLRFGSSPRCLPADGNGGMCWKPGGLSSETRDGPDEPRAAEVRVHASLMGIDLFCVNQFPIIEPAALNLLQHASPPGLGLW